MQARLLSWIERARDLLMNLKRYPRAENRPAPLLIAHRGAWNLSTHRENTLAAFQRAKSLGMGGIELDVHFTRDGVPVVHHDPDLLRLHGRPALIEDLRYSELQNLAPEIPTLEGVLALQDLHFMIEIKTPLSDEQLKVLAQKLSAFKAVRDFHLLTLREELVRVTADFPANCWILVGQVQLRPLVEISLARGYGGVAGHYHGMTAALIQRLHAQGQKAGAGFISSRNLLNRERARGIDWVYTNTAENLK